MRFARAQPIAPCTTDRQSCARPSAMPPFAPSSTPVARAALHTQLYERSPLPFHSRGPVCTAQHDTRRGCNQVCRTPRNRHEHLHASSSYRSHSHAPFRQPCPRSPPGSAPARMLPCQHGDQRASSSDAAVRPQAKCSSSIACVPTVPSSLGAQCSSRLASPPPNGIHCRGLATRRQAPPKRRSGPWILQLRAHADEHRARADES